MVVATTTRWAAYEAGRRSDPLPGSGVIVHSAPRMPFEQSGVLWEVSFANPNKADAVVRVDFELSAAVAQYSTVGTWCPPAHFSRQSTRPHSHVPQAQMPCPLLCARRQRSPCRTHAGFTRHLQSTTCCSTASSTGRKRDSQLAERRRRRRGILHVLGISSSEPSSQTTFRCPGRNARRKLRAL